MFCAVVGEIALVVVVAVCCFVVGATSVGDIVAVVFGVGWLWFWCCGLLLTFM